MYVFDKWLGTGNQRSYFVLLNSADDKIYFNGSVDGAASVSIASDAALVSSVWHYTTFRFDGANTIMRVDGVLQAASGVLAGLFDSTTLMAVMKSIFTILV